MTMTNQATIDKLIEMKLTSMADAFRIQESNPSMKEVSFEDRFGMLVDNEYTSRKNNRLKRLIFGMDACKHYYNTKYVQLPDLLIDLKTARDNGIYRKVMSKYANPILLILDEWLLIKPTQDEQQDIFELLHHRRKRSSTIFCSQYTKDGWYEQLGGDASPLADAILDRIVHDGYVIDIVPVDPSKDLSMREVYGLSETDRM